MKRYFIILITILLISDSLLYSQKQVYVVKRLPFSSAINGEFSPVSYGDGIVFCSDIRDNSLISYKGEHSRMLKIFRVTHRGKFSWSNPVLFSKELTSGFNDGPVTFNPGGNIAFYNRNNTITKSLKNIADTSNKLGIYSAVLADGKWGNIKPFKYNDLYYTFCTPSLAPDGKRIFFSSDKPGGFGGMDLYYCDSISTGWTSPVNLGPSINTSGNESFPFAAAYGRLYFASDSLKGYGGKDIFYTLQVNGAWINPIHLDSAINSPFDDFGIVTDSTFSSGFFSTNRLKTDDIFSFSKEPTQFYKCDTIIDNNYCFTFYDNRHQVSDTIPTIYVWDFGDGTIKKAKEAAHCFNGPGDYHVRLSIFDQLTGDTISYKIRYDIKLKEKNQPVIESQNIGIADHSLNFKAEISGLQKFTPAEFYWDFGDGFKPGAQVMDHSFKKAGEYKIRFGLMGESDKSDSIPQRCVIKKIRIFNTYQPIDIVERTQSPNTLDGDLVSENFRIKLRTYIYLMDNLNQGQTTVIRDRFKELSGIELSFYNDVVSDSSERILQEIADLLSGNPDLKADMAVNAIDSTGLSGNYHLSDRLANEVAFWFKNHKVNRSNYAVNGFGFKTLPLNIGWPEEKIKSDGFIELIFMKK